MALTTKKSSGSSSESLNLTNVSLSTSNLEIGVRGVGIKSISKSEVDTDGGSNRYCLTFDDGQTFWMTIKNGSQGSTGVGISGIEQIESSTESGGANTYRITFTDGNTFDFTVYNGSSETTTALEERIESLEARITELEARVDVLEGGSNL